MNSFLVGCSQYLPTSCYCLDNTGCLPAICKSISEISMIKIAAGKFYLSSFIFRKCMIMVDNIGNVSDMGSPTTFTKDQRVDIVLCLGELKNVFKVRRKFAKHYGIACHSRKILPSDPSKQSSTDSVRPVLHLTWRISDVLWPM